MDRKFNEFNKFNRGNSRRSPSRGISRRMMDEVRRKLHAESEAFRGGFRDNVMGLRDNLQKDKFDGKLRGKDAEVRGGSDGRDFTEDFHERQVDYHKGFRNKKTDEDFLDKDVEVF
ncbi:MAG: hypothetical protein FWH26_00970 [Oscillospiraceae bacterium]|nr:hypothetical protein [Oscillospiraceae bacterium]